METVINQYEDKKYSQNGEDGIIQYLIKKTNPFKSMIEFGFGSECNSRNLIHNFDWSAYLVDCSPVNHLFALDAFKNNKKVKVSCHFINRKNINEIFDEMKAPDHLGIISVDVDGMDYWLWKAMNRTSDIAVVEYNATFGPTNSITLKYNPVFDRMRIHPCYHGASLTALTKLAAEKDMVLVGCNSQGVNAFFVNKRYVSNDLPEVDPEVAFFDHWHRGKWTNKWNEIKNFRFIEV